MFYYLYFAVLISYSLFRRRENGTKIYCILTGICYFLVAALRSNAVGYDTGIYVNAFKRLAEMPLDTAALYADKDACFWMFLSLLGKITTNYTVLFVIVAGIFTVSAWHFIYKYSRDPRLSIIVLLAFNLYQFTITGMRQTIAISFIFWAMDFCYQKKMIKSILLVLVGAMFHSSALVFLIAVILMKYKKELTLAHTAIISFILSIIFLFRGTIAQRIIFLIQDRGYEVMMLNGGLTMTFVVFVLFLLGSLFIREYTFSDKNATLTYLFAMFACFFEMLVSTQSIFFRIAFYFLIIYVVFIPNVVETIQHGKSRILVRASIYVLLSIQYLAFTMGSCGIIPYHTFWQV